VIQVAQPLTLCCDLVTVMDKKTKTRDVQLKTKLMLLIVLLWIGLPLDGRFKITTNKIVTHTHKCLRPREFNS